MLKMVRTSVLWILLMIMCINCEERQQANHFYTHSQVLSVDVKSLHQNDNGAIVEGEPSQLIVFGKYLQENVQLTLTDQPGIIGSYCLQNDKFSPLAPYKYMLLSEYSKLFVYIPESVAKHMYGYSKVWLCYRNNKLSNWIHYGENSKIPVKHKVMGRRHLLRRSLIDDPTIPESRTPTESPVSGMLSKNDSRAGLAIPEIEPRNSNGSSVLDKISFSAISADDEFRTSVKEHSVGEVNDGSELNTSRESVMTMSLLAEEYPTTKTVLNKLTSPPQLRIFGMRIEEHSRGLDLVGNSIFLQADYDAVLRIFGYGLFTDKVEILFTAKKQDYGTDCDIATSNVFKLTESGGDWASLKLRLPPMTEKQDKWFICARAETNNRAIHQGPHEWLTIKTYTVLLPLWVQIIILAVLLVLSGLFSGLNLGLMALDKTELKVVSNTGTSTERSYAKSIEPVRRHGNFLLCTLLLGNVLVNSTLTILLDNMSTGIIAVIGSTIGIVIFGEILPQAICSRHGLAIGAKTVWLVRIFMVLTGIVSWPISKILDFVLGEELGNTYNRERLKELIRVTQDSNDIRLEEQNIICGALELHRKIVSEIMTRLEDVFMLSVDANLDFNTINEIMQQGYSRVPIFETDRTNIISVLFIKDLAFIDPDDNTPLRTLSQFYQNPFLFIFEDTTLDVMFKDFKSGNKGHMAFVQRVINENDCDPFYETVGLVTIEDVIEELIQEEIIDETDVFMDNRSKRKRKLIKRRDFKEFYQRNSSVPRKVIISPQMQVAAFQFLRTSVDLFKEGQLSEGILKKLLTQDIIHVIKYTETITNMSEQGLFIYSQGKPADYFVLILEGHIEVTIGRENLTFEGGPFSYFGSSALSCPAPVGESPSLPNQLSRGSIQSLESAKNSFSPDFSVKATSDVTFLKIRRNHYFAARRVFLLQQSQKDPQAEENFATEMAKIISDEHQNSMSTLDTSDKEASVKDTLLNGGALRKCNGEEDKILRSSKRNRSSSLSSTPIKEKNSDESNGTAPLSLNAEDC